MKRKVLHQRAFVGVVRSVEWEADCKGQAVEILPVEVVPETADGG